MFCVFKGVLDEKSSSVGKELEEQVDGSWRTTLLRDNMYWVLHLKSKVEIYLLLYSKICTFHSEIWVITGPVKRAVCIIPNHILAFVKNNMPTAVILYSWVAFRLRLTVYSLGDTLFIGATICWCNFDKVSDLKWRINKGWVFLITELKKLH